MQQAKGGVRFTYQSTWMGPILRAEPEHSVALVVLEGRAGGGLRRFDASSRGAPYPRDRTRGTP